MTQIDTDLPLANDEPRRCPFCGHPKSRMNQVKTRYYLSCSRCGCLGPNKPSQKQAFNAWNRGPKKEKEGDKNED